jgi:hypothetical protein
MSDVDMGSTRNSGALKTKILEPLLKRPKVVDTAPTTEYHMELCGLGSGGGEVDVEQLLKRPKLVETAPTAERQIERPGIGSGGSEVDIEQLVEVTLCSRSRLSSLVQPTTNQLLAKARCDRYLRCRIARSIVLDIAPPNSPVDIE